MTTKPSRGTIIESLRTQDRHPVADADRFQRHKDCPETFEAVHLAHNGSVGLTFTLESATECTTGGGVYDFDLLNNE